MGLASANAMAENSIPVLQENPVLSPSPAPSNDTARTDFAPGQNSLGEKIRAACAPVAAKFGVVLKPGRGRPKKDGSPKISDQVAPPAGPADVLVERDEIGAKFNSPSHQLFRRIVIKAATSEIALLKGFVQIKAEAADLSPDFVTAALRAATPEPKSFDELAESADYVAIKYGWNVDRMPEIALALDVAHIHAPFVTLFMALNAEIKRKRAAEKPAPAPQPQPEKKTP